MTHQSIHANIRSQQRCIPPFVDRLLDEFGKELHDGKGYIRVFFNHDSIKKMEKCLGRQPVSMFSRYFTAYRIESSNDGAIVTKGWLTKRIKK